MNVKQVVPRPAFFVLKIPFNQEQITKYGGNYIDESSSANLNFRRIDYAIRPTFCPSLNRPRRQYDQHQGRWLA